jgi:hypothetical protein
MEAEMMMPNKTIYVRDADVELWEKAEKLSGGSVSRLIAEALRRYVAEREKNSTYHYHRIVLDAKVPFASDKKAFVGRWLIAPDEELQVADNRGKFDGTCWSVAVTQKGKLIVYKSNESEKLANVEVYHWFDEARASGRIPNEVLLDAELRFSEEVVEELDV